MAYFNQDDKKAIAPAVKAVLTKNGLKGSLSVRNLSTVVLTIKSGSIDFGDDNEGYSINRYYYKDRYKGNESVIKFLDEIIPVLMTGWYDNSDSQTDYFDTAFYIDIKIGAWDKPYINTSI